jgi:DNA-directed RNA polymerase specialized sigma24 family protein
MSSSTAPVGGRGAQREREAFDRALAPFLPELLQAAQREVRHRLALGQCAPDGPTPEQLLDMALQHAWHERRRLSPSLGVKAWALASLFRTGETLGAREAERRRTTTELLPEEVEPDPLYKEDDQEF